jgi:thiol-disulfide isomerase/thioredoxin
MRFPSPMVEVAVLVAVLLGATAFGLWRLRTDGRVTDTSAVPGERLSVADVGRPLGERATLLQFSSAFCAPCTATRHVLGQVADAVPGVAHVEIDAESHLDLVRRLDIRRTPTTLVLDGDGREIRRATGVPRNDEVLGVLAEAVA